MREETPMRNGRRHGVARTWHRNGVLASEESYQDGQLHGLCRQWDEQGKLLGEYRMHHGTGIQRVWFENGVLQLEHSLINGVFTGPSRLWFQDGALATVQLLVENREVTPAKYAKEAASHPDWPRYAANGNSPRKLSPAALEKRAFRLHCEWLAQKPTTRDAGEWLNEAGANARAVGTLSAGRARKLVNDALATGARRVLAADTYGSKQGKQFADVLLVSLPKSKPRRAAIRRLFAALPKRTKCATQPDRDSGDPWLYVYFG